MDDTDVTDAGEATGARGVWLTVELGGGCDAMAHLCTGRDGCDALAT